MSADRGGFAVGSVGSMQVVQQTERRAVSGQAVRLDPRVDQVAGREELLEALEARLTAAVGTPGVVVLALAGLGGVGKSTTALEYAHRHLSEYDVIWFFRAEQATDLVGQFYDLAQVLDAGEQGDPVAAVHAALAAHPGRWLLVFDNVKDYAASRAWLPAKGSGHVLVTTRDGQWPAGQAVDVPPLRLEAASGFLMSRTASADEASARAIAEELGLLPVALSQAAAFMETTGRAPADYLNLLRTNRSAVLARGGSAHETPVIATWSLAMSDLAVTSPGSLTLLYLASFLAPDDIPFRMLLPHGRVLDAAGLDPQIRSEVNALCADPFGVDDAVVGLRRHSLISAPSATFGLHRLVQDVTRDQLPDDARRAAWKAVAAALIKAVVPSEATSRQSWADCRLLLPHARLVTDLLQMPMQRITVAMVHAGEYATARACYQEMVDAAEARVGPQHELTMNLRGVLARTTGETGDTLAALEQFSALVRDHERAYGPEDLRTLRIRMAHANWVARSGNVVEARELCRVLAPACQRVLGPEHDITVATHAYLASYTGAAGDPTTARDMYQAMVAVTARGTRFDADGGLRQRRELAKWTGNAGDPVAAREMLRTILPLREKVSGPEHPETLIVRSELARFIGETESPIAAREEFRALVPVCDQVLGPDHTDTLSARTDLARWTGETGDPVAARDQLRQILPARQRVSGPEHQRTLATLAELARWTGWAGDPTAARDLLRQLLPVRERVSGPDHADTRAVRAELARWEQPHQFE